MLLHFQYLFQIVKAYKTWKFCILRYYYPAAIHVRRVLLPSAIPSVKSDSAYLIINFVYQHIKEKLWAFIGVNISNLYEPGLSARCIFHFLTKFIHHGCTYNFFNFPDLCSHLDELGVRTRDASNNRPAKLAVFLKIFHLNGGAWAGVGCRLGTMGCG